VEFEWDPRKAHENLVKHGVTFESAKKAFDDPHLVLAIREDRVRLIGAGYWRRGKVFYEKANRLR